MRDGVAGEGIRPLAAAVGRTDERTRVLKQGDTFAVFDHRGEITRDGLGQQGLYHHGTRHLSDFRLDLDGRPPFFLGSTVRDENDQLAVALTNLDVVRDGDVRVPLGTLHLGLKTFLWQGVCHQQIRLKNHGLTPLEGSVDLHFNADYADVFETSGRTRKRRGHDLSPEVTNDCVVLGYRGLDDVIRRTVLTFSPAPSALSAAMATFPFRLQPQDEMVLHGSVACERGSAITRPPHFEDARSEAEGEMGQYKAWSCHLHTSNGQINAWIDRAVSDLHMMTTVLETGPYPYAGVPWLSTPFGRDGIITALECLWLRPGLARGVLSFLASTQARRLCSDQDAEPGKILHESRSGEMSNLREIPFGHYYGSVDATPLFVILAGAYYERTGDRDFVAGLWPSIEAALGWIDRYGDRDGDGFVEYQRESPEGLLHQGWKDTDDAVFHADGSLAEGPIALCEVQGYVYAARRAAATVASLLGNTVRAAELIQQADALRQRFEDAFWCEELSTYALALDGDKAPCRVRTSNAGQCLFAGIVHPERAARVARTLMAPDSFSGWGIRTVAAGEARYNPMSYHNGSIWPHDTALIAQGLARYGFGDLALQLWTGQFQAGLHFDLHRVPELFCGFPQDPGDGPIRYPVACAPQAWAAASVFLLFQACLGLTINGADGEVYFTRPRLPASLGELRIHNLQVGDATVDLLLRSHEHEVAVNALRRDGGVQIMVVM